MYCNDDLDQDRIAQADAAQCEWAAMGATDTAFGALPQYANEAYLGGYCIKLKELPTDEAGRLVHYSPRKHFAFGYVDTLNPACCDNEF